MKIHNPILSTVEKAVQDGLRAAGRAVRKESNANAPKDTGTMIKGAQVRVDDLTMQVSYPFPASIQHEALDYTHDDGGPKFLENAALGLDVETIIGAAVRKTLDG